MYARLTLHTLPVIVDWAVAGRGRNQGRMEHIRKELNGVWQLPVHKASWISQLVSESDVQHRR